MQNKVDLLTNLQGKPQFEQPKNRVIGRFDIREVPFGNVWNKRQQRYAKPNLGKNCAIDFQKWVFTSIGQSTKRIAWKLM